MRHALSALLLLIMALPVGAAEPLRAGEIRFEFASDEPSYIDRAALAGVAGIRSGDPLRPEALQHAIQNLYALKIFRAVAVYTDDGAAPPAVVFRLDAFPLLTRLRWEDVHSIKKRELYRATTLERGMPLSDDQIGAVRGKVLDVYRSQGFLDADAEMRLLPAKEGREMVVKVKEGRRFHYRRPDVEVLDGTLLPEARHLVNRLVNRPATRAALEKAQREMKKIYQDREYPAARVETFTDVDEGRVTVTPVFLLESGPRVTVRVEGANVGRSDLRKALAVYRLSDTSAFAEEISRDDLATHLRSEGHAVDSVTSSRRPVPEGEEILFVVSMGQRQRIGLRLEGVNAFSRRSLVRDAEVPHDLIDAREATLFAVKSRIERYYQAEGYLDVGVAVRPEGEGRKRRIVIEVSEGPQFRLADVRVAAEGMPAPDGLAERLERLRERPLTSLLMEEVRAVVSDGYSGMGYVVENIEVRQHKSDETVSLEIIPRLDGPYELDNVVVIGRLSTRPKVIQELIPLQGGRPLDMNAIYRAESALYSSGIFENVAIEAPTVHGRDNARNAVFNLREAPRYTFGYGFGYQDWERFRGLVEINDGNFLGRGWTAGLLFRLSQKKALVQLSFFEENFLFGRYPLNLSIYTLQEDQVSYKSRRTSIYAQTSKPLSASTSLFFRVGFEEIKNYDLEASYDPSDLEREEEPITLTSFSVTYLRDTRDSLVDPAQGSVRSVSVALAPNLFGVDTGFLKFLYQEQHYWIPVEPVILALSFRFGSIHTFAGDDPVPISERFFAGGSNTLRGFEVDRAGPLDPITNEPLGGNALVIGNVELRFPIYRMVEGAVFYDVGNVFVDLSSMRWQDVTHSVGAGLRLKTPLGPIRLDFGYSLKDIPNDKENQFFITIGNPF